ncbi:MAG TPA: winged helix-turn-helix domain-containing protein [Vicinamibacterales bacterium]|nr:winged helix-turn-helix domain-containing protein [Vicinamibacterales bacterium]
MDALDVGAGDRESQRHAPYLDKQLAIWQISELTTMAPPAAKPPAADRLAADVVKALANQRRLEIMNWLRHPTAHFPPQTDGDLIKDGVCGVFIAQKLGVSQPTASEHLRILVHAGLIRGKRIKQWTFYKRDEKRIAAVKRAFRSAW